MEDKIPPLEDGELPRWANDVRARKEEKNFPDEGDLRGQEDKNRLWALSTIGRATVILICILAAGFITSFIVWLWHQIGPQELLWLTNEQLSHIQAVIFSGAIGAIVSAYVQPHARK